MERLMGLENEYAFHATGPRGGAVERLSALQALNALALEELVCLPGMAGSGIYLGNGGRLYLDTGAHEEWCTPESANPWDVVRYLLAGESILLDLAQKLMRNRKLGSAAFYKSNVDYSGSGSTWGAHESYMHNADPAKLPADLIPFLVSRVIITGAGGFDPTTPTGCNFALSPRSYHINESVTGTSTNSRGIYHTKDEPLCSDHHRLHVLVGESLCSQTGNWLKIATTALVVAMAEAGLCPGHDVALCQPVEALRRFASDVTCKVTAPTVGGGAISALEIQQHYLTLAQRYITAPFMPCWARQAVAEWDAMLQRLHDAPDSVATCLDWAIKYRIYSARIAKRGFTWQTLHQWDKVMRLLHICAELTPEGLPLERLTAESIRDPHGPLNGIVRELGPHLLARGMHWLQFDRFRKLRLELFEVDTRFGRLGSEGIFNSLDRAGVLQHQFPGVDNIPHAVANPPAIGRAKVRGAAIQRLHGNAARYGCDWAAILDSEQQVALDLRDPWTKDERWSAEIVELHRNIRREVGAPF